MHIAQRDSKLRGKGGCGFGRSLDGMICADLLKELSWGEHYYRCAISERTRYVNT